MTTRSRLGSSLVGTKGQIVIPKDIRDELGIKPGWEAFVRIVDGQVRIDFLPPVDREALAGSLKRYAQANPLPRGREDEAMDEAVAAGIEEEWREYIADAQQNADER